MRQPAGEMARQRKSSLSICAFASSSGFQTKVLDNVTIQLSGLVSHLHAGNMAHCFQTPGTAASGQTQ